MKKYISIFIPLFTILLISSCATQSVIPPPQWVYEKGGVQLGLKADPLLNLYDNSPHTLAMCVYQLTEPNVFNQFINNREGLTKLLKCNRFDPSVASFHRLSIQPGKQRSESLDRAENAKYIAIAAGYYSLQKENMIRLFEIPVVVEKKGWFRRRTTSRPGPLNLYLYLGPQEIK